MIVAPNLPAVSGDETSITQILRNLLSNAAKYSGGSAIVTAVVEDDPDGVAVRVRDQGPGIDPLEAEAIFDPFFRSPSTAKMAGGAGIGLYVSRRLVGRDERAHLGRARGRAAAASSRSCCRPIAPTTTTDPRRRSG